MTMTESTEPTTESIVNGDDILNLARQCPLLLPVSSEDTVVGHLPKNKKDFKLKELYALLGCNYIEVVHIGNTGMIMVIDEEGALADQPQLNEFATILWRHHDPRAAEQYLFGKVILCPTECLK